MSDNLGIGSDTAASDLDSAPPTPTEPGTPAADVFTVKVNGEDVQVTREELVSGYQRQADYTRKTQEIAEARKRLGKAEALVAALERDPESTIRTLQDTYGIKPPPRPRQATPDPWADDLDDTPDPLEQRFSTIEEQLQQQQMAAMQAQLDRELAELHEVYGDFDDDELFSYALANGLPTLTAAYRNMKFDEIFNKATTEQRKQAEDREIEDLKRSGVAAVEGGSHRSGATTQPTRPKSIREAFLLATQQTG